MTATYNESTVTYGDPEIRYNGFFRRVMARYWRKRGRRAAFSR